jgi:hypothetical protein
MSQPFIKSTFSAGEVSPAFYGRVDLARWHAGCSVARNCFVNYKGGLSSRAGTALCGMSQQPASASSVPPRLIPFKFSLFQSYFLEFGEQYMRVVANGAYVTEAPFSITAITQALPAQVTAPGHNYVNGDWVFIADVLGMTDVDGETFIVQNVAGDTFTLQDTFGGPIDSRNFDAYAGGGAVSRLFTLPTPYHAADLPYLKFEQSADVLSLCCVNQQTFVEYATYDLTRLAANSWALTPTNFDPLIAAPTGVTAVPSTRVSNLASVNNAPAAQYAYVVTAVDASGNESIASQPAFTPSTDDTSQSVDISLTAGSITITWSPVAGAASYNVYKAPPAVWNTGTGTPVNAAQQVPAGSSYGFAGQAFGTQFIDQNVIPDQVTTPPLHNNPFARSQVTGVTPGAGGSGYAQSTTTASAASATGSGAVILPVVVSGAVVSYIVQMAGGGYLPGDALVVSGAGSGATGTLKIGPQTGTYPGEVAYFQQRRVYAYTINAPDTYQMSQPGAYTNFDSADPPIDSDAITGTPWAQQVNGIQWLSPMPGGLITGTGQNVWQVSGTGGAGSPISPAQQSAVAQESHGFSPTLEPLRIGPDILYGQALGSIVRDLQYSFYTNIYSGQDTTILSSHLFDNRTLVQWGWAEEPYKVIWAIRDDGRLLGLTWIKDQEIAGWTRHDTNGLFTSIACATEPPVVAVYVIVKRYIVGKGQWAYFVERMDNRLWGSNAEAVWAVDCGLALAQPQPQATLSASTASLLGGIAGGNVILGGSGYTAPAGAIVDPTGLGSGAVVNLTAAGGVITGMTCSPEGQDYQPGSYVVVTDATGSGAIISLNFDNPVVFSADQPVFSGGDIGKIIRMGGGIAAVTGFVNSQSVNAQMLAPIAATIPNDPNDMAVPAGPGQWTLTAPVSVIGNLGHLEGMVVTGLADGNVIDPVIVSGGKITLPAPASSVTVGLGFIAQGQTLHADLPGEMIQGKSKKVSAVTLRVENSRGIEVGQDQPIAAATAFQKEAPWGRIPYGALVPSEDRLFGNTGANAVNAGQAIPLFTGDIRIPITTSDWNTPDGQRSPGMVAFQQRYPLPLNVVACIPELNVGDTNG